MLESKLSVNNLQDDDDDTPSCTNPPDLQTTTAFIDSAASISLLGSKAKCALAKLQERAKQLGIPDGGTMMTTETLTLLLNKLPQEARKAYRVPTIAHNLIAVAALCDAGCDVHFYKHSVHIEYNGEVLYRGWRDAKSKL